MGMRYQTKDFANLFSNYYKHHTSMAESTKVALRGVSEYLWNMANPNYAPPRISGY